MNRTGEPTWISADIVRYRQVDSRTDPRVQVADLLAGAPRKSRPAEDLFGRSDPDLIALLRPYVDSASRWCEQLADPSGRTTSSVPGHTKHSSLPPGTTGGRATSVPMSRPGPCTLSC
jgi:hypothetical protein